MPALEPRMRTLRPASALGGATPIRSGARPPLAPLAGLFSALAVPAAHAGRAVFVTPRNEAFAEESRCLAQHGYDTAVASRPAELAQPGASVRADAVVIDGATLGADAAHWLGQLRQRLGCPLIVVANAGDEVDEILALELGADEYLVRPFSPRKFLARLRAVTRRRSPAGTALPAATETPDRIDFGPLQLDRQALHATCRGRALHLTPSQFEAVFTLAARAPRFVTREEIAAQLQRDVGAASLRSVDVLLSRLRKQLSSHGASEIAIVSVHARGYRLELIGAQIAAVA
jgi:DNA-binding response OmpR family regulator